MTANEIYRQLRLAIGNPSKNQVSNQQLLPYLQAGLEEYNRRTQVTHRDVPLVTVVGLQEYPLDQGIVRVEWVHLPNYQPAFLSMSDQDEYQRRYVEWLTTPAATPREYFVYQRKIALFPTPDAAYNLTMRCVYTSDPMTLPAAGQPGPLDLPNQDHRTIIWRAAAVYHASAGDPSRVNAFMALFESDIKSITGDAIEPRNLRR